MIPLQNHNSLLCHMKLLLILAVVCAASVNALVPFAYSNNPQQGSNFKIFNVVGNSFPVKGEFNEINICGTAGDNQVYLQNLAYRIDETITKGKLLESGTRTPSPGSSWQVIQPNSTFCFNFYFKVPLSQAKSLGLTIVFLDNNGKAITDVSIDLSS